jgi:hypothetical protein
MNPAPLSRVHSEAITDLPALPPTRDTTVPTTPSQLSRPAPKPRRAIGEKGTPRSSKLGQEVYSAATDESDEGRGGDGSAMDLDVDDK